VTREGEHQPTAGSVGRALDERRLRALLEAARGLVAELEIERLLERLLETARELTGARYAALGILDDGRRELASFVTHGVDAETHREIGDLPRGRGILGVLIEDPRPLRLEDVGDHPRSYGFPAGHPPMRSFLGVPILIRGEAYGNLYLTEKESGRFDQADEETVVVLAEWAAIAIENARLYESVDVRRTELERAVRGLEATTAIARAVGAETDLDRVLELIVKRARALVEARTLVILLEEGDELVLCAAAGEVPANVVGGRTPVAGSPLGAVVRSGRSERLDELDARLRASLHALGLHPRCALLVPLSFRARVQGVLCAFDRIGARSVFDREEERLLLSFAASAATAVATAKSVESQRLHDSIQASEQERRRWARELHDETLQALGGLRMLLASTLRTADQDSWRPAVEEAVQRIGEEIGSLRSLITELRPAALDDLGIQPALERLVERARTTQAAELDARVDLGYERGDRTARLEPVVESTIYRLVQEALTNIGKHAQAEHIRIEVVERDGHVSIEVHDDGTGFDPAASVGGFGLTGMRERVALVGGRLQIDSSEQGTTVRAEIPVRVRQEESPAGVRRA
jgi:signal transduction histidine kinase